MFLIFSILDASMERFQCLSEWSHCFTKRRKTEPSWTYLQKNRIKRNLKIRISQLWHTINQVIFIYEYIRQTVFLQIHFTNLGTKCNFKEVFISLSENFSLSRCDIFPNWLECSRILSEASKLCQLFWISFQENKCTELISTFDFVHKQDLCVCSWLWRLGPIALNSIVHVNIVVSKKNVVSN